MSGYVMIHYLATLLIIGVCIEHYFQGNRQSPLFMLLCCIQFSPPAAGLAQLFLMGIVCYL